MAMPKAGSRIVLASSILAAEVLGTQANFLAVRANNTGKQAAQHGTGMWVAGSGNSCPTGATMISQDECEAFALMDSSPHLFSLLSSSNVAKFYLQETVPFPTSDPARPKGCSVEPTGSFRFFFYNTHATGAAKEKAQPACKTDSWVMYKSKCPAGKESVSEAKCIDFTNDKHHYVWGGQTSSATDPPGCFGVAGAGMPTYGVDTFQVGKVFYNTAAGALTNPRAFAVCENSAAVSVPVTAGSGTAAGAAPTAAATGDPHMTTISGVKFDIMRTGTHTLFHIPQAALKADTLLRVQARVHHEGDKCEDMYIKVLNITGQWAEEKRIGGFSFVTQSPGPGQQVASLSGAAKWSHLGMVDLKVVRGKTKSGALYLNIYAKHLKITSKKYPIGGILGLDDHAEAATPAANCQQKVLALLHVQ